MTRVVQISDTHLSRIKPHFAGNWPPLRQWIGEQQADLIIHCGDVTVDGAGEEADFSYAATLMADLPAPLMAVPGNHDVGEPRHPHQPVDSERLARWHRYFGPDTWSKDVEGWRLLGLNSMVFGSGIDAEARQFGFLEETMAAASGRRIAWFLHQPLFVEDPKEGDTGYWSVKPEPRARLLALMRRFDVALVSSGHLHRSYEESRDGVRFVWSPSSAFVVGPDHQPPFVGDATLGALVYAFDGDGVTVERPLVSGLETWWIDDVIDEVYPPIGSALAST